MKTYDDILKEIDKQIINHYNKSCTSPTSLYISYDLCRIIEMQWRPYMSGSSSVKGDWFLGFRVYKVTNENGHLKVF